MSQPFIVTCPSCGKRLQVPPHLAGKRAKCACGQSIIVPSMPGLPVQTASPSTASPSTPIGYRAPGSPTNNEQARAHEHAALIRQSIIYSSLFILLIAGIFALRHFGSSKSASALPSLGEDASVEQMIRDEDGTEARQWLADRHGRMLSGMNDSQAQHHIDEWYKMGATKVYAFGGFVSMTVALQLPPNPAQRKTLFDWVNQWHRGSSTPPVTDVGQKYLLVRLRL